jgi:hypothetical protein
LSIDPVGIPTVDIHRAAQLRNAIFSLPDGLTSEFLERLFKSWNLELDSRPPITPA